MGASWSSYTFVGVRLDVSKLYVEVEKEVPGCEHANPETAKFCSTCGKPARVKKVVESADLERLPGVEVVYGTYDERGRQHRQVFVARKKDLTCADDRDYFKRLDVTDGVEAKAFLQQLLEPYGLWDEKEFGIWNVLYCSY